MSEDLVWNHLIKPILSKTIMPLSHNAKLKKAALLAYIYQANNIKVHDCPDARLISYDAYLNYFYDFDDNRLDDVIGSLKTIIPETESDLHQARWKNLLKPERVFPTPLQGEYTNTDDKTASTIVAIFGEFLQSDEGQELLPAFLKPISPQNTIQAQALFQWFSLNRDIIEYWYQSNGKSYLDLLGNIIEKEVEQYFQWVLTGETDEKVKEAKIAKLSSRFLDIGNLKNVLFLHEFSEQLLAFEANYGQPGIIPQQVGIAQIATEALKILPYILPKINAIEELDAISKNERAYDLIFALFMPAFEYAENARGYVPLSQVFGAYLYNNLVTNYFKPHILKKIKEGENITDILTTLSQNPELCSFSGLGESAEAVNVGIAGLALRDLVDYSKTYNDTQIAEDMVALRKLEFSSLPQMTSNDRVLDLADQCLTDDDIPALKDLLAQPEYQKIKVLSLNNNRFSQEKFDEFIKWVANRSDSSIIQILCNNNEPPLTKASINQEELNKPKPELFFNVPDTAQTILDLSDKDLCDSDLEEIVSFLITSDFLEQYPNINQIKLNNNFLSSKALEILLLLPTKDWKINQLSLDQNVLIDVDSSIVSNKVRVLVDHFPLLDKVPVPGLKEKVVFSLPKVLLDSIDAAIANLSKPWFGGQFGNWNKAKLERLKENVTLGTLPREECAHQIHQTLKAINQPKTLFAFLSKKAQSEQQHFLTSQNDYAQKAAILASVYHDYLVNQGIPTSENVNYQEKLEYYRQPEKLGEAVGLVQLYQDSRQNFNSWYTSFRQYFYGYQYKSKLNELRLDPELSPSLNSLGLKEDKPWFSFSFSLPWKKQYRPVPVFAEESTLRNDTRNIDKPIAPITSSSTASEPKSFRLSQVSQLLKDRHESNSINSLNQAEILDLLLAAKDGTPNRKAGARNNTSVSSSTKIYRSDRSYRHGDSPFLLSPNPKNYQKAAANEATLENAGYSTLRLTPVSNNPNE